MAEKQEKWILKPFNALFWALLVLFIVILIAASAALRNQSVMTRKTVLSAACIFTFVWFFVYKYFLSIDKEYDAIRTEKGWGGFNWWGELPLHLCNINMMLIPVAVLANIRPLESFCFFAAPFSEHFWRWLCLEMDLTAIRSVFQGSLVFSGRII